MTAEQKNLLRSVNQFVLNEESANWRYRTSQYLEVHDGYLEILDNLKNSVSDDADILKIENVAAKLRKQRNVFITDWLEEGLKVAEETKNFSEQFKKFKEEFSSYESRMIVTFTIILSMLSFLFNTVNMNAVSPSDILHVAFGYVSAVSMFSGMVLFVLNHEQSFRSNWKPILLVLLAIIAGVLFMCLK
ncbi:MAG: hypothetical protein J6S14_15040 [Clostridia bacterium]|nr:hypothetical protein [Clostridia bacterium]